MSHAPRLHPQRLRVRSLHTGTQATFDQKLGLRHQRALLALGRPFDAAAKLYRHLQ